MGVESFQRAMVTAEHSGITTVFLSVSPRKFSRRSVSLLFCHPTVLKPCYIMDMFSMLNNTATKWLEFQFHLRFTRYLNVTEHVTIVFIPLSHMLSPGCHSSITLFIPANCNSNLTAFSWVQWYPNTWPKMGLLQEQILPALRCAVPQESVESPGQKQRVRGHCSWTHFSIPELVPKSSLTSI